MAYTSGTAANYKDLLAVMATFAAANGWVILEQSSTLVFLKGTGLAGLDEIYVGVSTYEDAPNNRYNWNMLGTWGWRSGNTFTNHPRSSNIRDTVDHQVVAYLWNAAIPYWMVCTPRRIIVVAKIGTTYQHIHLGLLTVPATDAQYPYPLFIGGMGNNLLANSSASNRSYWATPGYMNCRLSWPGGSWATRTTATSAGDIVPALDICTFNESRRLAMLTALDGTYLLETIYVKAYHNCGIMGQFEGLFRVTGYNNTAENIITVSGVNYMVFPDGNYSTYGDYCALRLN